MADKQVTVDQIVSPRQEDVAGQFYLVTGSDGALYRFESGSKAMTFIADEGEWDLANETQLDDLQEGMVVQEGVENLVGRKVVLSDKYNPNYLSNVLIEAAGNQVNNNISHQQKVLKKLSTDELEDVPFTTIKQDASYLPENDDKSTLRGFFQDDPAEKLAKEIEKL